LVSDRLDLFKAALGLGEPWEVTGTEFDVGRSPRLT
jgi:hypothetical protein